MDYRAWAWIDEKDVRGNDCRVSFLKKLDQNGKRIMREHKFPYESFIAGWYIDEQICDDLIDLFNDNKEHQKVGVSGGPFNVQKNVKDSIDLGLS